MWLRNPLDDILSSRAKVAVLRALCGAGAPLNGREVARRVGSDPGHTSRVLRELAASGVLVSRDQGRATTYELAPDDSALLHCLRLLFEAEATRYRQVSRRLGEAVPEAVSIILFGSEARAGAQPGSDTDLLIVVPARERGLDERLADTFLQLATDHLLALSWHVADPADIRQWEESGHEFWKNIVAEGIALRGKSPERLRRQWQRGRGD